jgi:hypothetical protein
LALKLSQLDVGYADRRSDDELSAGHRVPPSLCPIDTLSWAVVTPDDDRSAYPEGVVVIRSPEVPRAIFVRPDGYVASDAMVSEALHAGGIGIR